MMYSEQLKAAVWRELKTRTGKDNAITQDVLFVRITGEAIIPAKMYSQTRIIRSIVRALRYDDKRPILSGSQGYWLAEDDQELEAFSLKLLKTAARQFGLAKALSKIPIDRMVKQHKLDFNNEEKSNDSQER